MIRILIQFEPALLTRLRATAAHNGVSVACLIRNIVSEWYQIKAAPK